MAKQSKCYYICDKMGNKKALVEYYDSDLNSDEYDSTDSSSDGYDTDSSSDGYDTDSSSDSEDEMSECRRECGAFAKPGNFGFCSKCRGKKGLKDKKPAKVDKKPAKVDKKHAKIDKKPAKVDKKPTKVKNESAQQRIMDEIHSSDSQIAKVAALECQKTIKENQKVLQAKCDAVVAKVKDSRLNKTPYKALPRGLNCAAYEKLALKSDANCYDSRRVAGPKKIKKKKK